LKNVQKNILKMWREISLLHILAIRYMKLPRAVILHFYFVNYKPFLCRVTLSTWYKLYLRHAVWCNMHTLYKDHNSYHRCCCGPPSYYSRYKLKRYFWFIFSTRHVGRFLFNPRLYRRVVCRLVVIIN